MTYKGFLISAQSDLKRKVRPNMF